MSDEKKNSDESKQEDKSAWNELLGNLLIKLVPTLIGGGVVGVIPIIQGDALSKVALYAAIGSFGGGVTTLATAFLEPTWKKTKEGASKAGNVTAEGISKAVQSSIAKATGAEAKYLEAQKLACQTDRCEGIVNNRVPLLEEIYVPLSISRDARIAGWQMEIAELTPDSSGYLSIWQLIRQIEQSDAGQMAILAWGGYGKTTLLKHLTYIYSSEQYDRQDINVSARIPVFLLLGECWRRYWSKQESLPDLPKKSLPDLPETIAQYHLPNLPSEQGIKMPSSWASDQLKAGKIIDLLDGLDEVPKEHRPKVSRWIDRQVGKYRRSIFMVTSRPKAYLAEAKADRISLRNTLWVKPFDEPRQRQFVEKWFLYQERYANNDRDTADVRQVAQKDADRLLEQIKARKEIQDLAQIPLLLNMIVSFYRSTGKPQLPKRRVDLYQRICDLQLKDRPEAKEIETKLIDTEAQVILQRLALEMLLNNREKNTDRRTLLQRLDQHLKAENETVEPQVFMRDIVQISELLVEKDADSYEFAHWSVQEYLAAKAIVKQEQEAQLLEQTNDSEWKPTVLLYVSLLKNPTNFIRALVDRGAVDLAYDCLKESTKQIDTDLTAQIEQLRQKVQTSRHAKLEEFLRAGEWEAADKETYRLMITTVGKEEGQLFDREDLENFPCEDLKTIDQLWVTASNGYFGFSVQKQIWEECGSISNCDLDDWTNLINWMNFADCVGWRFDGKWRIYADLKKDPSNSLAGELPAWFMRVAGQVANRGRSSGGLFALFYKLQ